MKTKLDQLLESIDPARTLDQVSARVDEALNSFRVKSGIIEDWEGFRTVLTEFYRHRGKRRPKDSVFSVPGH